MSVSALWTVGPPTREVDEETGEIPWLSLEWCSPPPWGAHWKSWRSITFKVSCTENICENPVIWIKKYATAQITFKSLNTNLKIVSLSYFELRTKSFSLNIILWLNLFTRKTSHATLLGNIVINKMSMFVWGLFQISKQWEWCCLFKKISSQMPVFLSSHSAIPNNQYPVHWGCQVSVTSHFWTALVHQQ